MLDNISWWLSNHKKTAVLSTSVVVVLLAAVIGTQMFKHRAASSTPPAHVATSTCPQVYGDFQGSLHRDLAAASKSLTEIQKLCPAATYQRTKAQYDKVAANSKNKTSTPATPPPSKK